MKKVLIVGAGSYVGESFRYYCNENYPENYRIDELDARGLKSVVDQFKGYDCVFYVAGIVHTKETKENIHLYYKVNRDLAIKVAKCAKAAGVNQFIVMSTMAVYGMTEGVIGKDTKPNPKTHYGKSKLEADRAIWKLREKGFKVVILRPPMIYGTGCKGNYQKLRKLALKIPVFPKVDNQRSMLYIGNLCEFIVRLMEETREGVFFPQNTEYVNTSEMVKAIAESHGKKIILISGFGWVKMLPINTVKKVFGSLTYEHIDEILIDFGESVRLTENERCRK